MRKAIRDGGKIPAALYRAERLASLPIDPPREVTDIDDELEGLDR